MIAGIQAATKLLESEILLRFVRTPDQQFFDKTMTLLGWTFGELPKLVQEGMGSCQPGTTHDMCSWCGMVAGLPPGCGNLFEIPMQPTTRPAQTPDQMIAGIQGTVKLLEAEILMRYAHTPNQRFFDDLARILAGTFAGLPGLSSGNTRANCGEGTIDYQGKCIGQSVIEHLQQRRPAVPR